MNTWNPTAIWMLFCGFAVIAVCTMPNLSYKEVQEEMKKPGTILIDVRERDELKSDGKIAQAKNIPLSEMPSPALKMGDAEFKGKYGFDKPKTGDHIVVHCKSGARAQSGAKMLADAGYTDVKVYPGINDWKSNGGSLV